MKGIASYGTNEIARICRVSAPTVIRWLERESLLSFKTPAGHRRVWSRDLLDFLKTHKIWIPEELTDAGSLKFLVLDDEPTLRGMMARLIRSAYGDADVQEAVDGFEAGHKIALLKPALVVLDLRLPGLDGFKVCRVVRSDDQLKPVKILAVSGSGEPGIRERILSEGANDFLAKPFHPSSFLEKVQVLVPASA